MKAPFPFFGGKSRIAAEVWRRWDNPTHYCEPFAGTLAVLLGRPTPGQYEYVNDLDGYIANFWRSAKYAPDEVARWADDPKSSLDIVARRKWLGEQKKRLLYNLQQDPAYYDTKTAGWWVWLASSVISVDHSNSMHLGSWASGIHRERTKGTLYSYMKALARRLEKVSIFYGSWTRLARHAASTAMHTGKTAIFLDPPYTKSSGRSANLYATDDQQVGYHVKRWAVAAPVAWPGLKVALCGWVGEHDMPPDWEEVAWDSQYGRGRERIWFSP